MTCTTLPQQPLADPSFLERGLQIIGVNKDTTKKVLDQTGVTAGVDSIVQQSLPVVQAACKKGTLYAIDEKIVPLTLTMGAFVGGLVLLGFVIGKYSEKRKR